MSVRKPDNLTLQEFCVEHDIARSTFYSWRAVGKGPRCFKLPNGHIRIRRSEVERWVANLEVTRP